MLSTQALKPMTRSQAVDRLVSLYKDHIDTDAKEEALRSDINVMIDDGTIELFLINIGKALRSAIHELEFMAADARQRSLLANAGQSVIEKFYFSAGNIDDIITRQQIAMNAAEDGLNQCIVQEARLKADTEAFRSICNVRPFSKVSGPVLDTFFGKSGMKLPYIDPQSLLIPADEGPGQNGMA